MTTFLNNPTVGQTKEITVASTTQSVELINLTHFAVAMSGTMAGQIVTLQPFQSKVCKVNKGETLEFETKAPVVATPQQNSEYVEIYESTLTNDGGITPLAMVPVYTSNVQLTGTNTVDINGGTVDATIQGTPTMQLAAGAKVEIDANGNSVQVSNTIDSNSTILNEYISGNPYVQGTKTTAQLLNGWNSGEQMKCPIGMYSEVYFIVHSQNGSLKNYAWNVTQVLNSMTVGASNNFQTGYSPSIVPSEQPLNGNDAYQQMLGPVELKSIPMDSITLQQTNNINVDDTITIIPILKFASTVISNDVSNPALQQAVTGAYSTQQSFNQSSMGINTNYTLIASSVGGYVQSLQVTYAQGTYNLYNGSQLIDSFNNGTTLTSKAYNFGSGVVNNGINVTCTSSTSTGSVNGFGAISQNTPPGVPKTIA